MGFFSRGYRSVSAAQARELIAQGHILVDVRTDGEWAREHIDGARHIPLGALDERAGELRADVPIVTVCHSGVRSALAARKLSKLGYTVANLRGGMMAWNRAR